LTDGEEELDDDDMDLLRRRFLSFLLFLSFRELLPPT
jgi:hypothetical protein